MRVCKTWFQATLDEAGTKQHSVYVQICIGFGDRSVSEKLRAIAQGGYKEKPAQHIRGNGYVVDSLEAALWCFWTTDTFSDAVLLAANLGDDADTTAAICGQIAGAWYGQSGIPVPWLEKLCLREKIVDLAEKLAG